LAVESGEYHQMNAAVFLLAISTGWLAGRCANWAADVLPGGEGVRFRVRGPLLILATMISFVASVAVLAPNWIQILVAWLYCAFLLTVLVIDYEHHRVLNIMLGPAAIVILALSFLPQTPTPQSTLAGGAIGFGVFLLLALIGRGNLGMGDVKLAGVIGLMLGYPTILAALVSGVILAAVAALWLLVTRRATLKSHMAYAPYLALGAIALLWFSWAS
jgi:prepilin signal peptidase PulO-like enzyme (type II secretory pathway)